MLRICDQSDNCPDDITGNFSSEADDTLDFISDRFAPTPPQIGNLWTRIACGTTCVSTISQADADQCAAAALALCAPCDGPCNNNATFCNTPQTGCAQCPTGTLTCFTVKSGVFCGFANQASADSAAFLFAQSQAAKNVFCLGPLLKCTCVGSGYLSAIFTSVPVAWSLVGGSLPPGLQFGDGFGFSTSIFGIPNASGTYFFQIRAETVDGFFALQTYSITVLEISTASPLPPYTIGVPYGPVQLQAVGGSGNYQWKIASGTLPPGLVMSNDGIISGTPT